MSGNFKPLNSFNIMNGIVLARHAEKAFRDSVGVIKSRRFVRGVRGKRAIRCRMWRRDNMEDSGEGRVVSDGMCWFT